MLRVIRQLWVFSRFISEIQSCPAAPGYRRGGANERRGDIADSRSPSSSSMKTPERTTAEVFPRCLGGEVLADSATLKWPGLFVRRYRFPRVVDGFFVPATAEPFDHVHLKTPRPSFKNVTLAAHACFTASRQSRSLLACGLRPGLRVCSDHRLRDSSCQRHCSPFFLNDSSIDLSTSARI